MVLLSLCGTIYQWLLSPVRVGRKSQTRWVSHPRVQKSSGKIYWYGMGSDPLDETDLSGSTTNSTFKEYVFFGGKRIASRDYQSNVNYYFADHLGTARIVADSSGTVLDDSDFYPFGGERVVTSSSGNRYKFTGKERDSESGLDNFGARYNSSSFGRFTSPDPIAVHPQKMMDPQQFNMYSYVRNNPLKLTDATGEIVDLSNLTDEDRKKLIEELQKDTGLTLAYNPSTGDLDVVGDPSKATGGSATFRKDLADAINSKDTFNVVDDPKAPVGSYDPKTKTASIDFAFFSKKSDAFTLGLTFYHEVIGHGLYGYGDPESKGNDAQAVLDRFAGRSAWQLEVKVAEELGVPVRMDYSAHQGQNGKWFIRVGEPLSEMNKRPWYQRFSRRQWEVEIPSNKVP